MIQHPVLSPACHTTLTILVVLILSVCQGRVATPVGGTTQQAPLPATHPPSTPVGPGLPTATADAPRMASPTTIPNPPDPSIQPTPEPAGLWIDESLYGAGQPERFQLSFDPDFWALEEIDQRLQLSNRALAGCKLLPTAGMGLPPEMSAESAFRQIGDLFYEVISIYRGEGMGICKLLHR